MKLEYMGNQAVYINPSNIKYVEYSEFVNDLGDKIYCVFIFFIDGTLEEYMVENKKTAMKHIEALNKVFDDRKV